ncbi:MAG: hypothetical protein JWO36_5512 [Myxococcales bacterium]|nr:hypothetical protein [Myxococcales bacterium]
MPPPLYVPSHTGLGALEELSVVPWTILRHAYGRGVTGDGIHDDVARSFRELAHDPEEAVDGGLYSNIYHQGTVYEATAYAVPFLAAIAAGDIESSLRRELAQMLGSIALAASFATADGSRAGAYGEGVDVLIREAFTRCRAHVGAIAAAEPELAEIVGAISAMVADPNRATKDALRTALGR